MSEANILFTLDGNELIIQCSKEDKMKDICQKYATKVNENINSLLFLYGGNIINFELRFKDQANSIDNTNNKMSILVYKNEIDEFVCPKCGERLKVDTTKIDEIISSNNYIKQKIESIKFNIENIIKSSLVILVNTQLENINTALYTINEDINKNNKKLEKLLSEYKNNINNNFQGKNVINGILDIKSNEINNKIILFNSDINNEIDVYLNNKKINMIKENKKWIIDYNFQKEGIYQFEIVFNNVINNMNRFFQKCSKIISLDFSNFNSSNINDMFCMLDHCSKLKEIKGINKLNTNNVTTLEGMFQSCYELEYLDLSNFNTSNVIKINHMFNHCYKLKKIKGINNFITNKVIAMNSMFQSCYELEYLDLSNFNTSNVTDMSWMFNECYKLKEIKGIHKFITNKVTDMNTMFQKCYELEYLDLSNFDTSNVTDMSWMFYNCNKLKYLNLSNFSIIGKTKYMLTFKKDKCNFFTNNNDLLNLYKSS